MTKEEMDDAATRIFVSLWPETQPRRSIVASAIQVNMPDYSSIEVAVEVPFIDGALLEVVPGDVIPASVNVTVDAASVLDVTASLSLGIVDGSPAVVRLSGHIRSTAHAPSASSLPWSWSSNSRTV
jgi:hypothetical protein